MRSTAHLNWVLKSVPDCCVDYILSKLIATIIYYLLIFLAHLAWPNCTIPEKLPIENKVSVCVCVYVRA